MAVTDVHGTQTATVTTEHTLADTAAAGTYVLEVDLVNMLAGDMVELRMYVMVLTAGTRRLAYKESYAGGRAAEGLISVSVPVSTALGDWGAVRATLKQPLGTSRNFPWALLKFA